MVRSQMNNLLAQFYTFSSVCVRVGTKKSNSCSHCSSVRSNCSAKFKSTINLPHQSSPSEWRFFNLESLVPGRPQIASFSKTQGTYAVKIKTHLLHFNALGTYMYRWAQIIPYSLVYILLSGFHNSQANDVCSSFLRVFSLAVCLSLMYWYAC